jgi:hypothetical protein
MCPLRHGILSHPVALHYCISLDFCSFEFNSFFVHPLFCKLFFFIRQKCDNSILKTITFMLELNKMHQETILYSEFSWILIISWKHFFRSRNYFFVHVIIDFSFRRNFWWKSLTVIFFISTYLRIKKIYQHLFFVHKITTVTRVWSIPLKIKFL